MVFDSVCYLQYSTYYAGSRNRFLTYYKNMHLQPPLSEPYGEKVHKNVFLLSIICMCFLVRVKRHMIYKTFERIFFSPLCMHTTYVLKYSISIFSLTYSMNNISHIITLHVLFITAIDIYPIRSVHQVHIKHLKAFNLQP